MLKKYFKYAPYDKPYVKLPVPTVAGLKSVGRFYNTAAGVYNPIRRQFFRRSLPYAPYIPHYFLKRKYKKFRRFGTQSYRNRVAWRRYNRPRTFNRRYIRPYRRSYHKRRYSYYNSVYRTYNRRYQIRKKNRYYRKYRRYRKPYRSFHRYY